VSEGEGEPDLLDGVAEAEDFAVELEEGLGDGLGEPVGSPPATTATSVIAIPGMEFLSPCCARDFFFLVETLRKVIPALAPAGVNSVVFLPTRTAVWVVVSATGLAEALGAVVAAGVGAALVGEAGDALVDGLALAAGLAPAAELAAGLGDAGGLPAAPTA
jgi:hypothetical protein